MRLSLTVSAEDRGRTVKLLLKNKLHISERLVKKLKYSEKILLNSVPVHVNTTVSTGDMVEAIIDPDEQNKDIIPEKMYLDIIYEDECLIAINKPANMVVHPTFRHFTGTVANGLMFYLLQKDIRTLVRPVSRLDRDTSGVIVFALNPYIQDNLIRQMHSNTYTKEYIGIVHGTFHDSFGTVDLPIGRLPGSIMLRHITPDGARSITHYEVIEQFEDTSYLKFRLETGRTHQIRVHCQSIGHPLLGDTLYPLHCYEKNHRGIIQRQALHSIRTVFNHPISGTPLVLDAGIPDDIKDALEILRK